MNVNELLSSLGNMKDFAKTMKDTLQNTEVEAEVGGGMLKIKINGNKSIVSMHIDDELMQPDKKDILINLILSCHAKASEDLEQDLKNMLNS